MNNHGMYCISKAYSTFPLYANKHTWCHHSDIIMSTMASQFTSLRIAYSTVYSGADQRKHQSSASLPSVTGELLEQRTTSAENVSIFGDAIMYSEHSSTCYEGYSCAITSLRTKICVYFNNVFVSQTRYTEKKLNALKGVYTIVFSCIHQACVTCAFISFCRIRQWQWESKMLH